ncbi:DUF5830 family protein [Methanococcoides sp. NM1]|uniref:DUF5830 family protein n=1 Tax=Methanococcoides sp. NM1 TaxID=1201013 RepID=UPI001083B3D6|nr:DUF5830 family protein [Methanococcoides sp. NM1]
MKYPKTIQKGLDYIVAMDATELSPFEIRELLRKTVTKRFDVIDQIMVAARKEGIITDKDGMCHFTYETHDLDFYKPKIIHSKEINNCRCCGRSMKESHYIELKSGLLGPYGSTCIRKLYLDYLFEEL